MLDGEVCILDNEGKENFKSIVSEIKRKDFTIKNPKYLVFDYMTTNEFLDGKSKETLSTRLGQLQHT